MNSASESVVFDRAAEFYDATRGLPSAVIARTVEILRRELEGRGRCLEIGVGTGRIALPLAAAGVAMVGVDLSRPMLAKLVAKSPGAPRFPIAVADATRLPFADGAFGAGLACHVLHLIPSWQEAIGELARVIRPGGVFLLDIGGQPKHPALQEIDDRFAAEAAITRRHRGPREPGSVDRVLAGLGAQVRELEPIVFQTTVVLDTWLKRLEENLYSWTWSLADDVRLRATAAARAWARQRFGALDAPRVAETEICWRAYDLTRA
jgi:ubiquinone/menaquinone biosynthesis C-methylase UbiE